MSIIKQFCKPEPIEIEVEYLSGEKRKFVLTDLNHDKIARSNEMVQNVNNKTDAFTTIIQQLAIVFDLPESDFEGIDFRTAKEIQDYILELVRNPTRNKGK